MSKIEYVTRETGSPMLISAESEWDFLDTEETLQDYPYILDSMTEEKYYLENELCSFFDEIVFEDKVVGFATFQIRNGNILLLTECFILPEFRGNRLFFDEICKMHFVGPEFGILQPTRNVVDLLLDYAFAKNFNENIVVSAIEFYFDDYDAKSSENRELDEDEMEPSNFYDLSINSTVFVDGDEVIYHDLLENDLRRHGKRNEMDGQYFANLRNLFSDNDEELNGLIQELKQELPQVEFGFNEVVGRDEGLSEFMQSFVDEDLLTYDEAIRIKNQLTGEYDSGKISDDEVDQRLMELVANEQLPFENLKEFRESLDSEEIAGEDASAIIDFLDVIGENEELGDGILKAVLTDDGEAFHNLIMEAMVEDEEFMDRFNKLADEFGDEYEDDEFFIDVVPAGLVDDMDDHQYKLDDTEYCKDYPVSYDREIYRILDALDSYADYLMIMNFIESEFASYDMLIRLMSQSQLIETEGVMVDWINSASEFTKEELKDILRENNLKVSGNKTELLKRLADNDVAYGEKLKITQKGRDYLKEFSWIEFYEGFLYDFDFNDFYRYLENHEGRLKDISLNYLDEHISLARKNNDGEYLENCILTKKLILDEGDKFIHDLNIPE